MPSRRIFKYELAAGSNQVSLPQGARILSCGEQYGGVVLWAEVDPDQPLVPRRIAQVATGGVAPEGMRFLGTVQIRNRRTDQQFVVHVFVNEAQIHEELAARFAAKSGGETDA
ncbi:MAG: hypothetical protein ITG02_02380 [Patulibacter sp.]|nr:hypothetical protein [Patulibacter sp.]